VLTLEQAKVVADGIDRLITAPIGAKFFGRTEYPYVRLMYEAARAKAKDNDPLTYIAAKGLIDNVKPGDSVIILTGWYLPMYMQGETDGPPGAAGIARAIDFGLQATPIVMTESKLQEIVGSALKGAGLRVYDNIAEAKKIARRAAVLSPLSPAMSDEESKKIIAQVLDEIKPAAVISVEKSSRNIKGIYHSLPGRDISPLNAKYDLLFDEARKRGIFTIGCGDGGNEIGLGNIRETVEKYLATGSKCYCGCGGGAAAAIETESLVIGYITNWAAYGIEAVLSLMLDMPEVMHNEDVERRVLDECARAGASGPPYGHSDPEVDEVPAKYNINLVELLKYTVVDHLVQTKTRKWYMESIKDVDLAERMNEEYLLDNK
jgi:hypothetical protein